MKTKPLILLALLASLTVSRAAIVTFDLSPAGTDHAVGLSPLNETPPAANSLGSGNEIGSGISFDTDTLTLSLSLGYGSAFGFTDLTGAATAAHVHGPAPTNVPAPVVIDLSGLHVPATNPASGGSIVGSVVLTTNQAADLLAGLNYINVHSAQYPAGEIRGQLIPVNTLPTIACPAAVTAECTGENGTLVSLSAQVSDADGDALTVIWTVNGVAIQTNSIVAEGSTNASSVTFDALYQLGTNVISISVSDGIDSPVSCGTTVTIVDTTPPTILSASLTPDELWPPNHKLNEIQVSIVATDICSSVTSKIKSISSSQSALAKGSGHTSSDWKKTGDLTAQIRAERSGKDKNGRTYTLVVEVSDSSGNTADTNLTVFVPHDQGQHRGSGNPPPTSNGNGNGNGNSNGNQNSHGKGKNK